MAYILIAFGVFVALCLALGLTLGGWLGAVAALTCVLVSVLSAAEVGRWLGSAWTPEA